MHRLCCIRYVVAGYGLDELRGTVLQFTQRHRDHAISLRTIAVKNVEQARTHPDKSVVCFRRLGRRRQPMVNHLGQRPDERRLREIIVHAGGKTRFAIAGQHVRRKGNDRHSATARCPDPPRRLKAVHFRHLTIHEIKS